MYLPNNSPCRISWHSGREDSAFRLL